MSLKKAVITTAFFVPVNLVECIKGSVRVFVQLFFIAVVAGVIKCC